MIHFVGAGPGAVDLITVRGQRLLAEADVVIYAGSLVNPKLLLYCRTDCALHNSATMTLEEIVACMVSAEENGLTTVRLHTGDPSLYGAIAEQMRCLRERGIAYDTTPGVTAAFGAAASLNIEYTLPNASQSLILTRMGGKTPVPQSESIAALAQHRASMAIYLSTGMAEVLQQELLRGGYEPTTSVIVVYKATWDEEQVICSNVNKFVDKLAESGITNTALILVGDNLAQAIGEQRSVPTGKAARSKLYDPAFATAYRAAVSDGDAAETAGQSPLTTDLRRTKE